MAASNHRERAVQQEHASQPALRHRCAVLGKPIAHSLSPVLHNAAYRALGLIGWEYSREEVGQEDFERFLSSLDGTWAGLSLTMPLKKTIMSYGMPCDRWSRELGLANTAVFRGEPSAHDAPHVVSHIIDPHSVDSHSAASRNGIALYNTDVDGIVLAFRHAWEATVADQLPKAGEPANVVILGNGNTALSALAACVVMTHGAHVTMVARHPEAHLSITQFAQRHAGTISVKPLSMAGDDLDVAIERLGNADIVISTLPAHAADGIAQLAYAKLVPGAVHGALLDVAYDPRPSSLQLAWSQAGGIAIGGEEMLLYQAIVQVCLMTGRDAGNYRVAESETRAAAGHAMSACWESEHATSAGDTDDVRLEQTMREALEEAM